MKASTHPARRARRAPGRRDRHIAGAGDPHGPYAVGDIYLAALPELHEVEIEDVLPAAQAIKIKGRGWIEHHAFEAAVKAKLGRAVYTDGLLGLRRKFIREA